MSPMSYPPPSEAAIQESRLINRDRIARSRAALRLDWRLSYYALGHTHRMASAGKIFDPTTAELESFVKGMNWHALGANTGATPYGPDQVVMLHNAFMHSAEHWRNIESAAFTRVGIGFALADHITYETQVFMG